MDDVFDQVIAERDALLEEQAAADQREVELLNTQVSLTAERDALIAERDALRAELARLDDAYQRLEVERKDLREQLAGALETIRILDAAPDPSLTPGCDCDQEGNPESGFHAQDCVWRMTIDH